MGSRGIARVPQYGVRRSGPSDTAATSNRRQSIFDRLADQIEASILRYQAAYNNDRRPEATTTSTTSATTTLAILVEGNAPVSSARRMRVSRSQTHSRSKQRAKSELQDRVEARCITTNSIQFRKRINLTTDAFSSVPGDL